MVQWTLGRSGSMWEDLRAEVLETSVWGEPENGWPLFTSTA